MGYTTDFTGGFSLNVPLKKGIKDYLVSFADTRRMKRRLGPEFGIEGEFYIKGKGFKGQDDDESVVDHNKPPITQPSLWCQWVPNEEGTAIVWDGGEKFYEYENWIIYIVKNFLAPNGYILNGTVSWQGEDDEDFGELVMIDNILHISKGFKFYKEPKIYEHGLGKDQVKVVLEHIFEQQLLSDPKSSHE